MSVLFFHSHRFQNILRVISWGADRSFWCAVRSQGPKWPRSKDRSGCRATTLLLYFAFALVHDSRGIEIVNFTISLALSSGTLTASAGTPYRLVPAHFYPCSPLDSWGKGMFSFYMYISSSMPVSTPRVKKKQDTKVLAITLLTIIRFSNFFSLADSVVNLQKQTHV